MRALLLRVLQRIVARRDRRIAASLAADPQAPARAPPTLESLLAKGEQREAAGDFDGALQAYREALAHHAGHALAQVCTGNALAALRRFDEAEGHYLAAVELDPGYAAAHLNLGNVRVAMRRFDQAEAAYREALRLRPGWSEAAVGVACALEEADRAEAAIEAYRAALAIDPAHAGAARNLSGLLAARGQTTAARRVLEESLARNPGHAALRRALAHRHQQVGEHAQALRIFEQVLADDPDDIAAASNRLFTLNFLPEATAGSLLREHRAWGERIQALIPAQPARTVPDPERRLKVGYVSPDFRTHPVALFAAPLFAHHDTDAFEVYAYANNDRDDELTEQIRARVRHWRPIQRLDDERAAALIREDGIDILVDLAGHTAGGRLRVFARKPAPVQVTWLGYLGTTGLPAMDYRLCDAHTDPPGLAEGWQVETPLRLPHSQWCYEPPVDVSPAPLPYRARGYWTFGSFNQLPKLNEPLLDTWARLLEAVPGSRLRIVGIPDTEVFERLLAPFVRRGLARERVTLVGRAPMREYLASHGEVDVALDSFPYTGGTTTCDALFMGVPVATVTGERSVARSGVSLLHTAGLADWVAGSLAELPELVRRQLADPERLARLREELPGRMRASKLMDAARFARDVETQYRAAWRAWCAREKDGAAIG
jgi:protein O-GlcNAc transferase